MTADDRPLAGFTVAVTAARRRKELAALLERRGARVVVAPAIRIVPIEDDRLLRETTLSCVRDGADVVIATTGIGFRGWLEAAESAGMANRLRQTLVASVTVMVDEWLDLSELAVNRQHRSVRSVTDRRHNWQAPRRPAFAAPTASPRAAVW